jgi:hypothetical protein
MASNSNRAYQVFVRSSLGALLSLALLVGCAPRPLVDVSPPESSAAAGAASAAGPTTTAPDAAKIDNQSSAAKSNGSCLMWYVCDCNLGCSKIAAPPSSLKPGLAAKVVSGTNQGTFGFVFEGKDKAGAKAFGLSPDKPGFPAACDYKCEMTKSGDFDPHRCDDGCE